MIIKGMTKDGKKFRPSQWAEMLVMGSGASCSVVICEGIKCINVDMDCEQAERFAQFAEDNELTTEKKDE